MSRPRLYVGRDCPCPSDCTRRTKCKECIAFHRKRGEMTYCEYRADPDSSRTHLGRPQDSVPTGRQIRMLEYAPCAG